ncbi:MAG: hypothetical protein AABY26_02200, partial [Nanoarchaeota archaeon]
MKLHKLFFGALVIFVFSTLALAVTIDKSTYTIGETVTISGSCPAAGVSVGLQAGIGINTVWVDEEVTDSTKQYTAEFIPTKTGSYTLYAACQNSVAESIVFNVGTAVAPTGSSSSSSSSSSSGSPGGGGGGGGWTCVANWSCTPWEKAYCNASLIKTRDCTDSNGCEKKKYETKNCTSCDESWVCTQWSACANGQQSWTCTDEHKCGTAKLKPALKRTCDMKAVAVPIAGKNAPPSKKAAVGEESISAGIKSDFWEDYKYYLLGGVAFVVLLFAVLVVMLLLHRHRHVSYNTDE